MRRVKCSPLFLTQNISKWKDKKESESIIAFRLFLGFEEENPRIAFRLLFLG